MTEKPWLDHYDDGVPTTLKPYPEKTLLHCLQETAAEKPDHPMLFFKGTKLSYGQIDTLSTRFAKALTAMGVGPGQRVAIVLPNCPQTVIAEFAAWKAGAVAAMVNPLYTEEEIADLLNECDAETVVVLTPFYQKVKAVQARTPVKHVVAVNIKEFLPTVLKVLFTLFKEKKEGHRIALAPGDHGFMDLLENQNSEGGEIHSPALDDPALLLFTGGTTGTPKGAVGTHGGLYQAATQLHAWFHVSLDEWNDIYIGTFPMFHVAGCVAVFGTAIRGRNPVVLIPNPRDIDDLVKAIKTYKPAVLPGVPTLFNALLKHKEVAAGQIDFKSIKICISGAAPLMAELKRRFDTITGGSMVEGYALTESMMAGVFVPVKGEYKEGSVGMPLPDVEVRIAPEDAPDGSLPGGEVGEILIRAPQIMLEYLNRPEATAETVRNGWLHTGDMGYLDDDGYLYIVDRKKDLIKPSGFQVWPREVEEVIAQHPAVAEVGVAGIPDDYQGESVKAWVVFHPDKQASEGEIVAFCKEKLAAYKVPKYIAVLDALPKSTVGKVLRRELAAQDSSG